MTYFDNVKKHYILVMSSQLGGCELGEDERTFIERCVKLIEAAPPKFFDEIKIEHERTETSTEYEDQITVDHYWQHLKKAMRDGDYIGGQVINEVEEVLHALYLFLEKEGLTKSNFPI